jgi:perosamine synthetase
VNRLNGRIGQKERDYVLEVLDTEFRSSKGSVMMKRLETAFSERFGVKYSIAHCNGTATLHSALVAAGVGIGDEVIVPPLTMSSTAFAVLHANAVPVFADIDKETFTIDPQSVADRITPRTKAIIPVSLYGLSPDMDPIMELASQHNLVVIEDDAQCFLGKYKGRLVGTIGHMSSFSFQSSKHMTSGEGGMVVTDDLDLATKVRRFSSLGYAGVQAGKGKITKEDIQDPKYERHVCLGFNYRMSEPCCAIALGQLEHLDELVSKRVAAAELFREAVEGCDWLIPQRVYEGYEHSYWSFVVRLERSDVTWYQFRQRYVELGGDGIYAAWQLTYLEPVFRNMAFNGLERLMRSPLYSGQPQAYARGLCRNAELVQPKLLQFKTNYWDTNQAIKQAEVLQATIRSLS